ncbi:isoleucine--tRNA ligase, partial [candidate division KSB1 bacterium]|nr:isoleucine--tRNA ligase [candidate division KSB1 bacterium]
MNLLKSQLNVEKVSFIELEKNEGPDLMIQLKDSQLPIEIKTSLDRKKVAPRAKQNIKALEEKVSEADPYETCNTLVNNNSITFTVSGHDYVLTNDDFDCSYVTKKGYASAERDNSIVIISTTRNKEMRAKGLVKDLARRLQTLRKERGYKPTDILNVASI